MAPLSLSVPPAQALVTQPAKASQNGPLATQKLLEGAEPDLPVFTQEWLLQLEMLDRPLALSKSPPPPIPPRRVHNRANSVPVKPMSPPSTPPSKTAAGHLPQLRPESSPTSAAPATPPQTPPRRAFTPDMPDLGLQRRTGSSLLPVPEDHALPSASQASQGRNTRDPFAPRSDAHLPPRSGSSMSMSSFVPVSTHDYPYAYLLAWKTYYVQDIAQDEGEKAWMGGVDEQRWEEERVKAFEWIRLKKITRRVAAAKQARAARQSGSAEEGEEDG